MTGGGKKFCRNMTKRGDIYSEMKLLRESKLNLMALRHKYVNERIEMYISMLSVRQNKPTNTYLLYPI